MDSPELFHVLQRSVCTDNRSQAVEELVAGFLIKRLESQYGEGRGGDE